MTSSALQPVFVLLIEPLLHRISRSGKTLSLHFGEIHEASDGRERMEHVDECEIAVSGSWWMSKLGRIVMGCLDFNSSLEGA